METRGPLRQRSALRRVAFDTNILVYAEDLREPQGDARKRDLARILLRALEDDRVVPAQVLAEGHFVLTRKGGLSRDDASRRVIDWMDGALVAPTTDVTLMLAVQLMARHDLPVFDAIILAAASELECDILYSEDFQHGFTWRGVEIVNPFL